MKEQNAARIAWADIIRAVGTLYIVGFWHIHRYIKDFSIKNIYTRDIAFAVLALFFFLSGYFLGKSEISSFKDILEFYRQRLRKNYFFICDIMFFYGSYYSF